MSSDQTRRSLSPSGTSPRDDPLREPLDDRRLADARLADQHRVVLRAAREDLDHAPDLLVAADHRVELPGLGRLGQVAAELRERLVAALGILRGDALAAAHLLDPREDLVARHRLEREEQVLGRDVVVLELLLLALGARRAPAVSAFEMRGCRFVGAASPTGRAASFCSASARSPCQSAKSSWSSRASSRCSG